jgi:hypothetical protein
MFEGRQPVPEAFEGVWGLFAMIDAHYLELAGKLAKWQKAVQDRTPAVKAAVVLPMGCQAAICLG